MVKMMSACDGLTILPERVEGVNGVINTLRPQQSYHFPDDIFKCVFLK